VPAIYTDKLLTPSSEKYELEKIKRKFYKERLDELTKNKKIRNTEVLKKIKEQPLEKISDTVSESYRFFWIPSFNSPVVIRVWRTDNKKFLVVKEVVGKEFEIKKLSYEKTKSLTDEEWIKFLELLDQSSFWNLPTIDIDDLPVYDGDLYIFEGNKNKKFHEIHRITPSKEFRELGSYLINLSGLKTEYEDY
jgi:integrase